MPFGLSDFYPVWSPAIKVASRGRASGGILVLVRKKHGEPVVLHRSENWVIIKTVINGAITIIGTFYFVPKINVEPALELLDTLLDFFNAPYPGVPIVLGRDFNGHIGSEVVIPEGLMDGVNLFNIRQAHVPDLCRRGRQLLEFFGDRIFFCLNGRADSDCPGKITYLAATGRSIVLYMG